MKDFDNALKHIEKAITKQPDNGFMYYIAGKIKFLQNEYEDAKMYLVKSYELEKTHDAENLLALCYYELGNFNQANEIFKSMLKENPMNVNLLLNSARCYEKLNDKNSALELLDKVVEAFPECEEAQEMIRAIS